MVNGKFEEYVSCLMEDIKNDKHIDIEQTRKKCYELIEISCKNSYDYGFAYGNYYLCELCMFDDDIESMISGVIDLLPFIREKKYHELIMRSYNILGIAFYTKGNFLTAIDYFLKAVDCKECNQYEEIVGMVYANISCIYSSVNAYEEQLTYCLKSYEVYKNLESEEYEFHRSISLLNLTEAYLKLGMKKKACECICRIDSENPEFVKKASFEYNTTLFKYYFAINNVEKSYYHLEKAEALECGEIYKPSRLQEYIEICDMLINAGEYDKVRNIINNISRKAEKECPEHLLLTLAELNVKFYKSVGDKEHLMDAYDKYYYYRQVTKKYDNDNYLSSIKTRIALKAVQEDRTEIKRTNEDLKKIAEIDELTTLPNRRRYERVLNEMFKEAVQRKLTLGVILIDVDCFKQYNDTYGHVSGDECLRKIGIQVKHEMKENILCARYGGDEFCIILFNKSDDYVKQCAKRIEKRISSLNLVHSASLRHNKVSITTGTYNGVPDELSTISDFINMADKDLYDVKRSWKRGGKNRTDKMLAI